jgi:DNA modification methylase
MEGDALAILSTLRAASVQMCCTSPPYYGLRDYGTPGQIGLEETPEDYIARLVEVFREVRRVLKRGGVLWLNLGDSYAGTEMNGKVGASSQRQGRASTKIAISHRPFRALPSKNLLGIPWRVAFALQADGWILRADIIWSKTNAMPESVKDRPTRNHEYVFLFSKQKRYYYNADAIREPTVSTHPSGNGFKRDTRLSYQNTDGTARGNDQPWEVTAFRNRRSVWEIPTRSYHGAHFAVMPESLVEPCVLAGSQVGDTVIDPFSGSGTVPLVARQLGRHYIGIEINARYIKLAEQRLHPH